jgi:hypothetical protein
VSIPLSLNEIAAVVARAATACRAIYRQDPQYANASNSAERVARVPGKAESGQHDWWQVGQVLDAMADREYDVWHRPRRLRLIERALPSPLPPPPPHVSQK